MHGDADGVVEEVYRSDWGRIVAARIRLVGDFEVAEEAAQEAFAAADRIRRLTRFRESVEAIAASRQTIEEPDYDTTEIPDDRLRLIFTCCHPALALEAQVSERRFLERRLREVQSG